MFFPASLITSTPVYRIKKPIMAAPSNTAIPRFNKKLVMVKGA